MAEVTIKRSAADLHIGSPDRAPSIQELVDRVIAITAPRPEPPLSSPVCGHGYLKDL
jgi:hypothetical protein